MRQRHLGFRKKSAAGPSAGRSDAMRRNNGSWTWRQTARIAAVGFVVGAFVVLPVLSLVHPPKAAADGSVPPNAQAIKNGHYEWHDRNTIFATIAGEHYYFRAEHHTRPTYNVKDSGCQNDPGEITWDNVVATGFNPVANGGHVQKESRIPQSMNVSMGWASPGQAQAATQCTTASFNNVPISNPGNAFNIFYQVSSDGRHITTVGDEDDRDYTQSQQYANIFLRDSENGDNCQDIIQVDKNAGTYKSYEMTDNGGGDSPPGSIHAPPNCKLISSGDYVDNGVDQILGNADALANDPNPGGANGGGGGGAGSVSADDPLGCDVFSSSPLSWIICPVIDMMAKAIQFTDNIITNQMVVPTQDIFCSNSKTCGDYYEAWSSFRNMALGLMAIAGLVIVIAQAIGMEVLDAYAVRKTLPRVLVAAVGITLSWALMNFAVTLSNNLGFGVRDLITAPFQNLDSTVNLDFSSNNFANFIIGGGAVATAGVAAWIYTGGIGILLSYVATAGLAVLVAILVLILRQIAVIMLILVAPLAIVAYIMPNTQRIFRFWWEAFTRALLMFPLIAAFIATGRVFAAISLQNNPDPVHGIIGFSAYFAPYFLIPLTFRFAGSAMGGIGNFINQRAQGGFNGLSQYRSGKRKERLTRARSGGLYRGANRFTRGLNKIGNYTLDADEQLAVDFGSQTGLGRIGRGRFNPVGYAGRKLLGRRSSELGDQIAGAYTEQTAKGAERAKMHYSTAWAAMGMLDGKHAGSGLDAEGRRQIDEQFGDEFHTDASGQRVYTSWKAPDNGDYEGLVKMGTIMSQHSADGSHAMRAGEELVEKAGTLSSFGLDGETQRATLGSVAAFQAARDGKLNAGDVAKIRNDSMAGTRAGTPERAIAIQEMAQLEQVATQQRTDLRQGKGIRTDANGEAYSVYSDKLVAESEGATPIEAYKSAKTKEALLTAKGGAVGAGKGEYWDETGKAYQFHAGRDALAAAEAMPENTAAEKAAKQKELAEVHELRKFVVQQTGIWGGGDPGAKAKADAVRDEMGITDDEARAYQAGYDPNAVGANAGNPGVPDSPDATGGAAV